MNSDENKAVNSLVLKRVFTDYQKHYQLIFVNYQFKITPRTRSVTTNHTDIYGSIDLDILIYPLLSIFFFFFFTPVDNVTLTRESSHYTYVLLS